MGYVWLTEFAGLIYWSGRVRFWPTIGSIVLTCAATRSDLFKWVLNTRLVQYLGDISYALYLVHSPIIRCFAVAVIPELWEIGPQTMTWVWTVVIGFFIILYVPVVLVLSDLTWRFIDTSWVNLARWIEAKCFISSKTPAL